MKTLSNDSGLFTIRQQIEHLKTVHQARLQNWLLDHKGIHPTSSEKRYESNENGVTSYPEAQLYDEQGRPNEENKKSLDDEPVIGIQKNFEDLVIEKISTEPAREDAATNKVKPKQPFLRKGEGLARYRMTPDQLKRRANGKTRNSTAGLHKNLNLRSDNQSNTANSVACENKNSQNINRGSEIIKVDSQFPGESNHLNGNETAEFEHFEEVVEDSSFSSSSSAIMRLMDDTVQSTPVKSFESSIRLQEAHSSSQLVQNIQYFNPVNQKELDIIREESFREDCTIISEYEEWGNQVEGKSNNERTDIEISDRAAGVTTPVMQFERLVKGRNEFKELFKVDTTIISEYERLQERFGSEEESCSGETCECSECSCLEQLSHFMSKSFSDTAEEAPVYSHVRKTQSQNSSCQTTPKGDKRHCVKDRKKRCMDDLTSLEQNHDNAVLKMLLRARIEELEEEISTFKKENLCLKKIKKDYENEYNKFVVEKEQVFKKIREDREKEIEELNNEKKRLQREKAVFEKYTKDLKNQPNKKEREEIKALKEEVANLKEEMNKKEGRWAAAQARIRMQMRQLKTNNTALRAEIEQLHCQAAPKVITSAAAAKSSQKKNVPNSKKCDVVNKKSCSTDNVKEDFKHLASSDPAYNTENARLALSEPNCIESDEANKDSGIFAATPPLERSNSGHRIAEINSLDDTRETLYPDGRREIWYSNGNVKKVSPDGNVVKTIYYNGDVKEVSLEENIVKYYYAKSQTWHTTYKDGFQLIEFSNGQIEKRFSSGVVEIVYPSGISCTLLLNGEEKWTLKDGSVVINNKNENRRTVVFPNGEREVHTKDYKKHEYLDGTVKYVYTDGTQETRYSNGRIRVKNSKGELVSDSAAS